MEKVFCLRSKTRPHLTIIYIPFCVFPQNFVRRGSRAKEDVFSESLTKGVNKLCLHKPGVYHVTPVLCHQFEQDTYSYDTYVHYIPQTCLGATSVQNPQQ